MDRSFRDRRHAGKLLAGSLAKFSDAADTVVMALPRGGVAVAFEIAEALHLPLDVCVVRKLGVPWQPELAMGAIASGGATVLNRDVISRLGIHQDEVEKEVALERGELDRREKQYRSGSPHRDVAGKTVIVVDDGIATGATVEAAVKVLRQQGAARIVIAVGVAPPSTVRRLSRNADEVVSLIEPQRLSSVGEWFEDFEQVTDAEVRTLLAQSRSKPVRIGAHRLAGDLQVPSRAVAVVVFAHGSGSSRRSSRNRYVASQLNGLGFATLLMDLLTEQEDQDATLRFDIDLLSSRVEDTLDWLKGHREVGALPVALFGASTGAAAALDAAARNPGRVFAVVSRGGRPDLAAEALGSVTAPTLLIVGGEDEVVVRLNRGALRRLPLSARLEVVPGATHLFEEPGKLEAVAELAGEWFRSHLPGVS